MLLINKDTEEIVFESAKNNIEEVLLEALESNPQVSFAGVVINQEKPQEFSM